MEIRLQLFLIACTVNFDAKSVQPDEKADQVFLPIANSYSQNKESYYKIWKHEAWERQAFHTMKEELRLARNKNARQMKKFQEKINVHENIVPRKRETNEPELTPDGKLRFPENPIFKELRILYKDACDELIKLDVNSFMAKSVATFKHLCQSMSYSHYLGYRNVYNDILAVAFVPFNNGSTQFCTGLKPGLIARGEETTFLLEFTVDRNASIAMAEIEKYVKNFCGSKTNILGIGINFHFFEAPYGYKNINASYIDKLYCDWEAKLYSEMGEVKEVFPRKVEVLDCPFPYTDVNITTESTETKT